MRSIEILRLGLKGMVDPLDVGSRVLVRFVGQVSLVHVIEDLVLHSPQLFADLRGGVTGLLLFLEFLLQIKLLLLGEVQFHQIPDFMAQEIIQLLEGQNLEKILSVGQTPDYIAVKCNLEILLHTHVHFHVV